MKIIGRNYRAHEDYISMSRLAMLEMMMMVVMVMLVVRKKKG